MSSLRCRLNWHDWTKYGQPVNGYSNLNQFRECTRCGKISISAKYFEQVTPDKILHSVSTGIFKEGK
jgi:hypothetical protein